MANQYVKRTEEEKRKYVESFLGSSFSYVGGYIDSDHKVTIKCNKCGSVFERSMVSIRHNHSAECDNCNKLAKEEAKRVAEQKRKQDRIEQAEKRKAEKETELFLKTRLVECETCGKVFATTRTRQVCCSAVCQRKKTNRIASHRKDHRIKPDKRINWNITAKKLYDRDAGVCWICGGRCDLKDFIERDGTIICGNNYPSIDHVVPISEGGEDSWENVRLAHRDCNSKRYWGKLTPPLGA